MKIFRWQRCLSEWSSDIKYFTEFVVALNHKIREWYGKENNVAKLYDKLWREADSLALEIFQGKDKEYYLREKMKAIQEELGDKAKKESDIELLRNKIIDAKMPKLVEEKALKELNSLLN